MAQDFEGLLKEVFGDSMNRLTQLQSEGVKRLMSRVQDIARESMKDELTKMHTEIAELRARVATLEGERARNAAESIESSF